MSDKINNVRMSSDWDTVKDGWMAFALQDGTSDGVVYDNRDDAIRHHRNRAKKYFFVTLRQCIHGMSSREATMMLAMVRVQSERGRYHPETDRSEPITPLTREVFNDELVSTKLNAPFIVPNLGRLLGK
jgi:hypothetical protein